MRSLLFAVSLSIAFALPAAATPCPGSGILFQDSFAATNSNWDLSTSTSSKAAITGGQFVVNYLLPNSSRAEEYQGDVYGDVNLCATVTAGATDKAENQLAGLIYWATDYTSYYCFQVNPVSGQFEVAHLAGGRWLYPLGWTTSAAIKTGMGVANALQVQTRGTTATLFINGTQVGTMTGTNPNGGGLIGFYTQTSTTTMDTWNVTDFSVSKP